MEHMTLTMLVAANVTSCVTRSGVTVAWLCGETGIARSTMGRKLKGRVPFNVEDLDRIAGALHVPLSSLVAVKDAA